MNLLENNSAQLNGKSFIADLINILSSNLLELENDYNASVPVFLSNLATQYSVIIGQLINKNVWSNTLPYQKFNFVTYNNEVYMCIQDSPAGTVPTNTSYWLYLGLQGEKGTGGITDVTMKYVWNRNTIYNQNDLVVYGKNRYVALKENTGAEPDTQTDSWGVFIVSNPGQIFVGTTPPDEPIQDTVWFQTESDPLTASNESIVLGTFQRYFEGDSILPSQWEPMYPNVLFRWLDGYDNYTQKTYQSLITITPSAWANQQYIYNYPFLDSANFVFVSPGSNYTSQQNDIYNSLSLEASGNQIIFSTSLPSSALASVALPIVITIQ